MRVAAVNGGVSMGGKGKSGRARVVRMRVKMSSRVAMLPSVP
jgi:hypothetical protein